MEPVYAAAKQGDLEAARMLLAECGLPNADLDKHLPELIVARAGSKLAGIVGLEPLGTAGLFRSLAVAAAERRRGIGKALCDALFASARKKGITRLYLLTMDAASYFERLDFSAIARADTPPEVRATEQFGALCPSTATVMMKKL